MDPIAAKYIGAGIASARVSSSRRGERAAANSRNASSRRARPTEIYL